jgi:hypothetical protein
VSIASTKTRVGSKCNAASAQQAVEPIFSISDPYSFHNVHDAFENGFADPAFSNAIMFAIAFAENNHQFTPETLLYQGQAIQHINQQLNTLTSLENTIGAILLLVGVEVRSPEIPCSKFS